MKEKEEEPQDILGYYKTQLRYLDMFMLEAERRIVKGMVESFKENLRQAETKLRAVEAEVERRSGR